MALGREDEDLVHGLWEATLQFIRVSAAVPAGPISQCGSAASTDAVGCRRKGESCRASCASDFWTAAAVGTDTTFTPTSRSAALDSSGTREPPQSETARLTQRTVSTVRQRCAAAAVIALVGQFGQCCDGPRPSSAWRLADRAATKSTSVPSMTWAASSTTGGAMRQFTCWVWRFFCWRSKLTDSPILRTHIRCT